MNYAALFKLALCGFISQNGICSDSSWHSADICCISHHTGLLEINKLKKKDTGSCTVRVHFHSSYLQKLSRLFLIFLAATCKKKSMELRKKEKKHGVLCCCIEEFSLTVPIHISMKVLADLSMSPYLFHSWSVFLFSGKGDSTFS